MILVGFWSVFGRLLVDCLSIHRRFFDFGRSVVHSFSSRSDLDKSQGSGGVVLIDFSDLVCLF